MSSRRPSSPSGPSSQDPSHHRNSSIQHQPLVPSNLRESHSLASSPEDLLRTPINEDERTTSAGPSPRTHPTHPHDDSEDVGRLHGLADFGHQVVGETTGLLRRPFEIARSAPHEGECNHGTFSPRLESRAESVRSGYGFGGSPPRGYGSDGSGERRTGIFASFMDTVGVGNGTGGKKKMSTTSYLAERHGIKHTTSMYVLPLFQHHIC